jgi:hypothetical protein
MSPIQTNGPTLANTSKYNAEVKGWGLLLMTLFRMNITQLKKTEGTSDLAGSLKLKTKTDFGEIDRLSLSFERHGVFFHKGVGRGYKIIGGKVMRIASNSKMIRDYAEAKGRSSGPSVITASTLKRQPREWFNPALEQHIQQLIDIVANYRADQAVDATAIKIR